LQGILKWLTPLALMYDSCFKIMLEPKILCPLQLHNSPGDWVRARPHK